MEGSAMCQKSGGFVMSHPFSRTRHRASKPTWFPVIPSATPPGEGFTRTTRDTAVSEDEIARCDNWVTTGYSLLTKSLGCRP